jgi:hypothetical protein
MMCRIEFHLASLRAKAAQRFRFAAGALDLNMAKILSDLGRDYEAEADRVENATSEAQRPRRCVE